MERVRKEARPIRQDSRANVQEQLNNGNCNTSERMAHRSYWGLIAAWCGFLVALALIMNGTI